MRLIPFLIMFAPLCLLLFFPWANNQSLVAVSETITVTTVSTGTGAVSTVAQTTIQEITQTSIITQLLSKKITERPAYPLCDKNAWFFNATVGQSVVGTWSSNQPADFYMFGPADLGTVFAWYNYREDCDPTSLPFNFQLNAKNVTSASIDVDIPSTGRYFLVEVTRNSAFGRLYQLDVNLAVKSTNTTTTVIESTVYPVFTATEVSVTTSPLEDWSLIAEVAVAVVAVFATVIFVSLRRKRIRIANLLRHSPSASNP